ncbi:TBC1 domain family member 2A isoform X2 [Protopterus annectens]|uniref:TBC1 domain family member 2A isoform X2 n=1 Tax=Protopterus annectens TaxID=7888 RepID=UPI001CF9406D|nr:TBC1 domain family member 2A isoform X2 [Protopterus annectens]
MKSSSQLSSKESQVSVVESNSTFHDDSSTLNEGNAYSTLEAAPLTPTAVVEEVPRRKLCGYLNKLGVKGPLKTWKSRWFIYDEKKHCLLYYKTAQDVNPLDSIDLSCAVFSYDVEGEEGVFQIETPNRVCTLKAASSDVMLYWLQQLQMKRALINSQFRVLASNGTASDPLPSEAADNVDNFLPPVKTPTYLVGEKAAFFPAPQQTSALQNISIKHPWTEIQNTVHSFCGSKMSQEDSKSVFYFEDIPQITATEDLPVQNMGETAVPNELALEEPKNQQSVSPYGSLKKKYKKRYSTLPHSFEKLTLNRNNSQDKVTRMQQEILTLSAELQSQKEVVKLLHKALETMQQEKQASSTFLATETETARLILLQEKVREVAHIRRHIELLKEEKLKLEQELCLKDSHIEELKQHVQMLMEKNNAKQEVILKLSEQVFNYDDSNNSRNPCRVTLKSQQEEIEHLKDDIGAYKLQNRFLNSELYQVTKLWRSTAEQERNLIMKCAYMEARNCRTESKYLTTLRRLQESVTGVEKRIIEDVLRDSANDDAKEHGLSLNPVREYDEYGFKTVPDYEIDDLKLLAKIQALEIKSSNVLNNEMTERTIKAKWKNMPELVPSDELKTLIRYGIPVEYRREVWKWIVSHRLQNVRHQNHYAELLKKCKTTQHPASKQIELDLHRTLTSNKHFASPSSEFVQKLRRVLLAFSWKNPTIGYCQGLNRLAAIALLVLEEEETAFWCLYTIVEILMPPDYYSKTLTASQVKGRTGEVLTCPF